MMMVEPDGLLFAGDVVQNGRIPFMNADDVDTANWLRSLGEVEKLDPKIIIPATVGRRATPRTPSPSRRLYCLRARRHEQGRRGLGRFRRRL